MHNWYSESALESGSESQNEFSVGQNSIKVFFSQQKYNCLLLSKLL